MRLSPFAGKVRVALAEKGLDMDLVEVKATSRPPRLAELNPTNRVPVLELDDGPAIFESSVICEWLEEEHPEPPLWPSDPVLRGSGRAWLRYLDDFVTAPFFSGMRTLAFGKPDDPGAVNAELVKRLRRAWPELEAALGANDGPWLLGEDLSYADIGAMAIAVRLPEWRGDLVPDADEFPRLAAWLGALRERPSAAAINVKGQPIPA